MLIEHLCYLQKCIQVLWYQILHYLGHRFYKNGITNTTLDAKVSIYLE